MARTQRGLYGLISLLVLFVVWLAISLGQGRGAGIDNLADTVIPAFNRDHAMPLSSLDPDQNSAQEIIARCRAENAEEIASSLLVIREALADGFMPRLESGLCLVVENDFPERL